MSGSDRGFAMSDALVALFLLSLTYSAMLLLQVTTYRQASAAEAEAVALKLASDALQGNLRNAFDEFEVRGRVYKIELKTSETPLPETDLSKIVKNVVVRWDGRRKVETTELSTIELRRDHE